jgi:hypothetical protein
MRQALAIVLTMALMPIGTATAADAPMEEVVVTGEYAGRLTNCGLPRQARH